MPPEKPLIEAVPELPPLEDRELRSRAADNISVRPTMATARDIAGRIYVEPDQAFDRIMAHYVETGDREALISEVERLPSDFGEVRGTTRLGIANGERRSALEQTSQMANQMDKHLTVMSKVEGRIVEQHSAKQVAMQKPLPDLSQETGVFLERMAQVRKMPSGAEKVEQMRDLLSDKASVQDVVRFRQALTERYGKGQETIQKGVDQDPALKSKSATERKLVQTRVDTVMHSVPVISHMRDQIKQRDRARELGKDQSRGIER